MGKIIKLIASITLIIIVITGLLIFKSILHDKGLRAFKMNDYAKTLKYMKPLALLGDSTAQDVMGEIHAFGLGVKKDEVEALKWFRRASSFNGRYHDRAAPSAYYVGDRYRTLYENSNRKDSDYAMEALKWYRISAEGGYPKAAEFLGKAYAEGLLGLTRDLEQSRYWYEMSKKTKADKKEN